MAFSETLAWAFLAYLLVPVAFLLLMWLWGLVRRLMGGGTSEKGDESQE
jgi:hypothetical protein